MLAGGERVVADEIEHKIRADAGLVADEFDEAELDEADGEADDASKDDASNVEKLSGAAEPPKDEPEAKTG